MKKAKKSQSKKNVKTLDLLSALRRLYVVTKPPLRLKGVAILEQINRIFGANRLVRDALRTQLAKMRKAARRKKVSRGK